MPKDKAASRRQYEWYGKAKPTKYFGKGSRYTRAGRLFPEADDARVGEVDLGIGDDTGESAFNEDTAHVLDYRLPHATQGNDRITAEMRRDDDIGRFEQNVIAVERLALDNVGGVAADLAGFERGDQVGLLVDFAAAGIDEDDARTHQGNLLGTQHA